MTKHRPFESEFNDEYGIPCTLPHKAITLLQNLYLVLPGQKTLADSNSSESKKRPFAETYSDGGERHAVALFRICGNGRLRDIIASAGGSVLLEDVGALYLAVEHGVVVLVSAGGGAGRGGGIEAVFHVLGYGGVVL